MLSPYEKDKIKEGVTRIRREVPEATEEQMHRMLLYAAMKMGTPFNETDAAEARKLISTINTEINKSLN